MNELTNERLEHYLEIYKFEYAPNKHNSFNLQKNTDLTLYIIYSLDAYIFILFYFQLKFAK
jgi:hypothetical protein